MVIKGITKRWIINNFGLILAVLIALEIGCAFFVKNYYYNEIEQALYYRASHINTIIVTNNLHEGANYEAVARDFVEEFTEKEKMELVMLDKNGSVIVSSSGFSPEKAPFYQDYIDAKNSESGYGVWTGKNTGGEKVLALTKIIKNSDGNIEGAVRYVVSLTMVDRQIFIMIGFLLLIGLVIIFFVIMSGVYFINSIVNPVRTIGATARLIAMGDLNARIVDKHYDDEIGELCDTINYMAAELSAAERLKNDFISSVSHELRTPLTAIKGWGETILSAGQDDPETVTNGMNVIISEAERLSRIVEELLDFSRIESGRMKLHIDKIDILAEIGEAVLMLGERAKHEGKRLLYNEPEMLPFIYGDKDRLKQVFVIVLDNALKYSDPGDSIIVSANSVGDNIVITISDSGCGIPETDLPMIKEKFYKGSNSRGGSGIGLAVADEIITLHSGKIDIESKEGVGTKVTITLPIGAALPEENVQAERSTGKNE